MTLPPDRLIEVQKILDDAARRLLGELLDDAAYELSVGREIAGAPKNWTGDLASWKAAVGQHHKTMPAAKWLEVVREGSQHEYLNRRQAECEDRLP